MPLPDDPGWSLQRALGKLRRLADVTDQLEVDLHAGRVARPELARTIIRRSHDFVAHARTAFTLRSALDERRERGEFVILVDDRLDRLVDEVEAMGDTLMEEMLELCKTWKPPHRMR